ncbi:hypothetical protein G7046_g7785 [Stylonectria norvegica]|nr:hypothetical protein G7046_g7785 [Stylonectria norvegica]
MLSWVPTTWNFDIDYYFDRFIPSPPWNRIPYPIAYFLGHRRHKPQNIGTIVPILWAFLGVFCGISVIEVVSVRVPAFVDRGAPMIVASFGAGAVLEFYTIDSPLSQPRNLFGGQLIAAIVGVSICKLFQLSADFVSIRWVAGAISCATVTAMMALTKTVPPPGRATALIAVVDDHALQLGWYYIPVVLLNCSLMMAVALLINNIQRAFPAYWWTPEDLKPKAAALNMHADEESKIGVLVGQDLNADSPSVPSNHEIIIRSGQLILPEHVYLMQEEKQLLEEIGSRL